MSLAPHRSLRARVTAAFALGALLTSAVLAVLTYGVTRRYLVRQRESLAVRQTYVNARLVRSGLQATESDVPSLLGSLETPAGSQSLVLHDGEWYGTSVASGPDTLPPAFQAAVIEKGAPARQFYRTDSGAPRLAVGVPLPAVNGFYFELFAINELNRTLRVVGTALLVAATATTAVGALAGRWASGRVLHPLTEVAATAAAISQGDLTRRLRSDVHGELATLAHSFNSMVDALQQRIERDARFASDVSHELRSPLTTLMSAVRVLERRRHELSARGQTALDLLSTDLARFTRLVEDLLEISRAETGAPDLVLDQVDVLELVARVLAVRDSPVTLDADGGSTLARVDKRRLERVIVNLLDNADAHGGGVVRVGVRGVGDLVRIEVDDIGPGVAPDQREAVFARFHRGEASGRRGDVGGVGLGLALVHEHVRVHLGRVWIEGRPGGGARAIVELPAVHDA